MHTHISVGGFYTEILAKLQAKGYLQRHIFFIFKLSFVVENNTDIPLSLPHIGHLLPTPNASPGLHHTIFCVLGPWVMYICIYFFVVVVNLFPLIPCPFLLAMTFIGSDKCFVKFFKIVFNTPDLSKGNVMCLVSKLLRL